MEVYFTPDQEAQLAQIANGSGTAAEEWVRNAVLRLIETEPYSIAVAPELPRWDLGAVGPLHRRDLYDDGI